MFSLLQQTAPTAVETTTTTAPADQGSTATTITVPLNGEAASTGAVPVAPVGQGAPAAAESTAAQTHATDSIIVPNASGAEDAPAVAQDGEGHLPTSAIIEHADGTSEAVGAAVPGTDETHAVVEDHAAAESAGMPQLDFATFGNQIFWLLVALALIYFILSRVALPRIGRILGDRQGLMTADLAAAEDFKRKAREAEAAYEKALADARAEANKIVAANKAEIDAELKTAIARADAEIAARTQESERRIAEIRQSAASDARTVARDVAAELVRAFGGNADGAIDQAVDARIKGAVL
ncbi:F-type H+-transporting ATPase subunit b [Paracoccus chinensis]|uniref:ATP synthase subunit b n=2 Tax=Paracoccus chinensis TaxID=525640 RepID=A0A1G9GDQ3_9RHOB|nr:F-type H+-transporting ATPase subunit b [Paracoccus chinensis]